MFCEWEGAQEATFGRYVVLHAFHLGRKFELR